MHFYKGDSVVLAKNSHEGAIGTFLNLKDDDPKLGDIDEQNSEVRPDSVGWLQHSSRTDNTYDEARLPNEYHSSAGR